MTILITRICSLIVCLAGLGLFEANVIQFGMDQLLEASSDQLGTFIHWYYWSLNLGRLMLYYILISLLVYFRECYYFDKETSNCKTFLSSL